MFVCSYQCVCDKHIITILVKVNKISIKIQEKKSKDAGKDVVIDVVVAGDGGSFVYTCDIL